MLKYVRNLICSEEGATATEYAVLLGLITMGVISAIATFGTETGGLWGGIDEDLDKTPFGSGS